MSEVDAPTEAPSTVLDPQAPLSASGGGAVAPPAEEKPAEPAKPQSVRDVVSEEVKKEEKPADEAKSETDDDGEGDAKAKEVKPEAKDKPEVSDKAKPDDVSAEKADEAAKAGKPEDKGERIDAPKRFLPDAKETWRNTPRAVQRDVANMLRQHEQEVERFREVSQRYDSIREYDELAKSNGRDLRESLAKISEVEDLMQANPYAGLNAILQEIGPKRPDGSAPTLFEVAEYIVRAGPDKWQQLVAQRPANDQPAQKQVDPEVQQLKQELTQIKQQQLTASVIEPFKAANPRYEELREDIAFFLKSGKIPASLSMPERLAAAYDMAERINPPSDYEAPRQPANLDPANRVAPDSSGSKSIKSAPGSVSPDSSPQRGGSIRDVLRSEAKRQRRA